MILYQNIEISWSKQARGGKMATVRNAIPEAFKLLPEKTTINQDICIWGYAQMKSLEDSEINKFHHIFMGYEFEAINDTLLIFKPKGNGFKKKILTLPKEDSIRIIKYWKSMDWNHNTVYHKSVLNLFYGEQSIPEDYFLMHEPTMVIKDDSNIL